MNRMMFKLSAAILVIYFTTVVVADNEESSLSTTTTQPPQPVFKPSQQSPGYIPHQTYPFSDSYSGSIYDGFFYPQMYPAQPQTYPEKQGQPNYPPAVIPETQGALQFVLRALAKFGLFALGGVAMLLIGGIFTTIICHLTPICEISFFKVGGLSPEAVRSLMTPDKISAAAALVQDAIGKYQRLQRAARV